MWRLHYLYLFWGLKICLSSNLKILHKFFLWGYILCVNWWMKWLVALWRFHISLGLMIAMYDFLYCTALSHTVFLFSSQLSVGFETVSSKNMLQPSEKWICAIFLFFLKSIKESMVLFIFESKLIFSFQSDSLTFPLFREHVHDMFNNGFLCCIVTEVLLYFQLLPWYLFWS